MAKVDWLENSEIEMIMKGFSGSSKLRDLTVFFIGISTALRVSEILCLNIGDVVGDDCQIKKQITIASKNIKNKEAHTVMIKPALQAHLKFYVMQLNSLGIVHKDSPLFLKTRKYWYNWERICHDRTKDWGKKKVPTDLDSNFYGRRLPPRMINKAIDQAAVNAGLGGKYGSHTARKTSIHNLFIYFCEEVYSGRIKGDPIVFAMDYSGHKTVEAFRRYLKIDKEQIERGIIESQKEVDLAWLQQMKLNV